MHPTVLLQADGSNIFGLFLGVILVIGLCIGGYFAISKIRHYLKEDEGPTVTAGFGLSDLREMLAQGQITQDEFDKAKHNMVASVQRKANEQAATQPPGPIHHLPPNLKDKR